MSNGVDQEFLQSLNEEEGNQIDAALSQARANIEANRNATKQAAIRKQYEAERDAIAQRFGAHGLEPRIRALTELKAKYRALGLQV